MHLVMHLAKPFFFWLCWAEATHSPLRRRRCWRRPGPRRRRARGETGAGRGRSATRGCCSPARRGTGCRTAQPSIHRSTYWLNTWREPSVRQGRRIICSLYKNDNVLQCVYVCSRSDNQRPLKKGLASVALFAISELFELFTLVQIHADAKRRRSLNLRFYRKDGIFAWFPGSLELPSQAACSTGCQLRGEWIMNEITF